MFPFFGRYLTGLAGAAGMIVLAMLDIYLAIALFRLNVVAWWIAVVTMAMRLASMVLSIARADILKAYSKMGRSDDQLRVMNASPILRSHVLLWGDCSLQLPVLRLSAVVEAIHQDASRSATSGTVIGRSDLRLASLA